MAMQIHELVQGSPEWHAFRFEHNGASEAAAMLGISTKVKRSELLRVKHTGIAKEFSDWVQENILDHGHYVEAMARPIIEELIGEDLYPVTCSKGNLSASCDGLTMDETTAFEHKQWNAALAESVAAGTLPDEFQPQCQQIMLVTPARRVIFVVSDGTRENMVHMEVFPDFEWQERIIAGWAQFDKDLATYVPMAEEVKPIGKTPETLPALHVKVTGMVTASNLAAYKEHAMTVFAGVNRELTTEQHFADAEKIVEWCGNVESRLEAAKEHALSQTKSIDELFKTIDDIKAESRRTRLDLDKLVTKRKDEIRSEIVVGGKTAYSQHVASLNKEISPAQINVLAPDFASAIKGKRSIESMRDAVDVALANGKIAADAQAKSIRINLKSFESLSKDYEFLFPDIAVVALKEEEYFKLAITSRIDAHKAKEVAKKTMKEQEEKERIEAIDAQEAKEEASRRIAEKDNLDDFFDLPFAEDPLFDEAYGDLVELIDCLTSSQIDEVIDFIKKKFPMPM
jgi:predicted phage-related endonuclease